MDIDAFTAVHQHDWKRLDELSAKRRLTGEEADELLLALSRVRPGGGERRANSGANAVLTKSQYKADPERMDQDAELVLRFDYGRSVPWVTQLDDSTLRAILRAGVFELMKREDVPVAVIARRSGRSGARSSVGSIAATAG